MTDRGDMPRPPGGPGAPGRWIDGRKDHIGTAIAETSRVWFSTARGVVTEVFYPTPDQACTRLIELVVCVGDAISEEVEDTRHDSLLPYDIAPLCALINRCRRDRYLVEKEILADPRSDVILQRVRFAALPGAPRRHRVYCVIEPHLGNRADDNTAIVGAHKGHAMLFAQRDGLALALACSAPLGAATAGFIGADGRGQLRAHGALVERFAIAERGNASLTAEIDVAAAAGEFVLALAFARTTAEAGHLALGSLYRGYEAARSLFLAQWQDWHARLARRRTIGVQPLLWNRSATVLKTLEAKLPSGGRVAALATPWGEARGPGPEGTYHLVWTRDLVQSVGALLAMGAEHEARHALHYLRATQEPDGHWSQNMIIAGDAVWNGDELDEAALPIVFVHLARRERALSDGELRAHWPMIRAAAGWIARRGPATPLDRWEDTPGVTPFTISAAVAGLLIAAELAELCGEPRPARYLAELADEWNQAIEPLLYRTGGPLAERVGVAGYYVRARRPGAPLPELDLARLPGSELSPDALALVRFGLRAADDPRIADTVRVIDAVLRTEFPAGPAWRRYPGDRYGEHADGSPFDGGGIGRPWPLLTGERAHYELARGELDRARALLRTMASFAGASGCLPEQIWDQPDLEGRGLVHAHASGSAAPLGWAHAEYIKLCRSLADGAVFDMPRHAHDRYIVRGVRSQVTTWRAGDPPVTVPSENVLRVTCTAPAIVRWRNSDGAASERRTIDTGLGIHYADLPAGAGEIALVVDKDRGLQRASP